MSIYVLPLMVFIIIVYGIIKKVNVYDAFIEGAKESFDMTFKLFPNLLAMILGVNIFLKSNILDYLFKYFKFFFNYLHIPFDIIPLIIVRPISGGASLAIVNNILKEFGPDGLIGRLASVILGSSDTTFYVLTLYFGTVGIKKIRYALWAGLLADLIGIIVSITVVNLFF